MGGETRFARVATSWRASVAMSSDCSPLVQTTRTSNASSRGFVRYRPTGSPARLAPSPGTGAKQPLTSFVEPTRRCTNPNEIGALPEFSNAVRQGVEGTAHEAVRVGG